MNVLIAGGNPTAAQLASFLLEQGHEVCLIEDQREVLAQLHLELPTEAIYKDSATNLIVLEDAGIRSADVFVACTSDDADNLLLCYLASTLYQVPRTIGRINNPRHAWLFNEKLHVDVALNESHILALLIAEEMSMGDMMTLLKLRKGLYSLVEEIVVPTSAANGKALRDLGIPPRCVLAAIIREGELIVPRGDTVLKAADEVLAVVHSAEQSQLAAILGPAIFGK